MSDIICYVTVQSPTIGRNVICRPSQLGELHASLRDEESMSVVSRERHAFIKVTAKYPTGAPSLRSFFDVCGMEDCGLASDDPVHY